MERPTLIQVRDTEAQEAGSIESLTRERGDNLFPRCALIGGMHETSYADWWDARMT